MSANTESGPASHAGLVLAAGASSRMGGPKPLLDTPGGIPLGRVQHQCLIEAGCRPVLVVLGCRADEVAPELTGCTCVVNQAWQRGRVSSVQTGLRVLPACLGCVLLPVDTAGIAPGTIRAMLRAAEDTAADAVRPCYRGRRGKVCWFSSRLFPQVLALDNACEDRARLDSLLRPLETRLDVEDAAILNNANTPEEWSRIKL